MDKGLENPRVGSLGGPVDSVSGHHIEIEGLVTFDGAFLYALQLEFHGDSHVQQQENKCVPRYSQPLTIAWEIGWNWLDKWMGMRHV